MYYYIKNIYTVLFFFIFKYFLLFLNTYFLNTF